MNAAVNRKWNRRNAEISGASDDMVTREGAYPMSRRAGQFRGNDQCGWAGELAKHDKPILDLLTRMIFETNIKVNFGRFSSVLWLYLGSQYEPFRG